MHGNGTHKVPTEYVADLLSTLTPPSQEMASVDSIILDMDQFGQAIIEAEGDIALVAEKLLGSRHKQSQLLRSFTADQGAFDAFALKSRAFIMAKLLHTFSILNTAVVANIADIKPVDAVKALSSVATVMADLSKNAPQTQNTLNIFETAMRAMPVDVQEAAKRLALNGGTQVELNDIEDATIITDKSALP